MIAIVGHVISAQCGSAATGHVSLRNLTARPAILLRCHIASKTKFTTTVRTPMMHLPTIQ